MSIGDLIEAAKFLDNLESSNKEFAAKFYQHSQLSYFPSSDSVVNQKPNSISTGIHTSSVDAALGFVESQPPLKKRRISNEECLDANNKHQNDKCQAAVRRANMRSYFEKLKELVPLCPDTTRHTTVTLLNKAVPYIQVLEEEERQLQHEKSLLLAHEKLLQKRMQILTGRTTMAGIDNGINDKKLNLPLAPVPPLFAKSDVDKKLGGKKRAESKKRSAESQYADKVSPGLHTSGNDREIKDVTKISPLSSVDINYNKISPTSDNLNFSEVYQQQLNTLISYYSYFKELSSQSADRLGLFDSAIFRQNFANANNGEDNVKTGFPYHLLSQPLSVANYQQFNSVGDRLYSPTLNGNDKNIDMHKFFANLRTENAIMPDLSLLMPPLNNY